MSTDDMEDWSIGWYCLRAKPRMEMLAAQTIGTLKDVEVFLPRTVRPRKEKTSPAVPLFPGYFFARFDPVIHLRNVHFARGVSYIVRRKEVPVHVPPQVMIELRLLSPDGILEIPDHPHKVGDKVKAISGLFKGDQGTVTQLVTARERVKVLFEILGRPTEVEIDEDLLDFPKAHPMSSGPS
ncbi:MAG: transcription termination/antitermination protein NusG [Opitutales bacterium]|jgi:transcriptional antiterminator RfaH